MLPTEISALRLFNQKITTPVNGTPQSTVEWMGAMQAQDFQMAKLAIASRTDGATDLLVEEAYNRGDIIRTHLMRPTWHLVSAKDVYWMLELTSAQIMAQARSRNKELGLTPEVFARSRRIIEGILSKQENVTREEIATEYMNADIRTDENRLSHLLFQAELEGVVCSGPIRNKKLTHALLCERVPEKNLLARDEALATLASRYFASHGPATLSDFIWWSGLPVKDARKALEAVKPNFISETIEGEEYWLSESIPANQFPYNSVHMLPAYDEFLISYRNRDASLALVHNRKAISNNGMFYPIVVVDSQVTGTWRRTAKKDHLLIEVTPFSPFSPTVKSEIEKKAAFMEKVFSTEIKTEFK